MADRLEAIAYEEAKKALDEQAADVDSLKTRATAILSVGAVVAGLLGPKLISAHKLGVAGWIALVAFALAGLGVIFGIFWPREWGFSQDIEKLIAQADEVRDRDPEVVGREIQLSRAKAMRKMRIANDGVLKQQTYVYMACCFLLVVQVVAWLARALG